jgi:hypothetical protein
MPMNVQDLVITISASFGKKMFCVAVRPVNEFIDGKRQDKIVGYRYTVVLQDKKFDRIDVRVDGPQTLEVGEHDVIPVTFTDMAVCVYMMNGKMQFSVKASAINVVKTANA